MASKPLPHLLKTLAVYGIPPLTLAALLFWPIYKPIDLVSSESVKEEDVKVLSIPVDEDLLGILGIHLPGERHRLCLVNKNRVFLVHNDNYPLFKTPDLSRSSYVKESQIGAMAVELYFNDGTKDDIYREIGEPRKCIKLGSRKLQNLASSSVLYRHVSLKENAEIDLGDATSVIIGRLIARSLIDTSDSSATIMADPKYFFLSLVVFGWVWRGFVNRVCSRREQPNFHKVS